MVSQFIARGSYGCTFRPKFRCNNSVRKGREDTKDQIGKIFSESKEAEEEWAISRILEKIDPHEKLFLYPSQICDVDLDEIRRSGNASKCPHVSSKMKIYKQVVLRYGGVQLHHYIRAQDKKFTRSDAVFAVSYILYGVKALLKHGYIHQDIKSANIVMSNKGIRLIDFGLFIHKHGFYDDNSFYTNKNSTCYPVHPTEFRYHHLACKRDFRLTEFIEDECKLIKRYVPTLSDMFLKNEIKLMHSHIINQKRHCDETFKEHNIPEKTDIFAVGTVLANLSELCVPEDPRVLQAFNELVEGMITPNVFARWNIDAVIKKVNEIKKKATFDFEKSFEKIRDESAFREFWESQECNPATGRCIKTKTERLPPKECPPGKERNPATGRCIKK
jgi:serine/threonine protein kinase